MPANLALPGTGITTFSATFNLTQASAQILTNSGTSARTLRVTSLIVTNGYPFSVEVLLNRYDGATSTNLALRGYERMGPKSMYTLINRDTSIYLNTNDYLYLYQVSGTGSAGFQLSASISWEQIE